MGSALVVMQQASMRGSSNAMGSGLNFFINTTRFLISFWENKEEKKIVKITRTYTIRDSLPFWVLNAIDGCIATYHLLTFIIPFGLLSKMPLHYCITTLPLSGCVAVMVVMQAPLPPSGVQACEAEGVWVVEYNRHIILFSINILPSSVLFGF